MGGETLLVYISTFVSPHTLPLGIELTKYYEKVVFINTMSLTQERRQLGYAVSDPRVEILDLAGNEAQCRALIDRARDVILAGANFELVAPRIRQGKSVFLAHERLLKKGAVKLLDPRTWRIAKFCLSVRQKPVYLLAIGDNSARDFRLLGFNAKKIFRFGYFPKSCAYSPTQLSRPSGTCNVLWVGRFVDVKRPMMALKAFRDMGSDFALTMVGDGALFDNAKRYAQKYGISVEFTGSLSAEEVEQRMLESHILLSTSHKGEGWGAVINEGMNRGCAVVCSRSIGCVGSLVTNENAVFFRTCSMRDLRRALREATYRREELGQRGYDTVTRYFNAEQAALRFAALAKEDGVTPWDEGLCSRVF